MIYLKFKVLILNLRNRRGIYLFDNTYKGLTSFLMGYQLGIENSSEIQLSDEFQNWLRGKFNSHFSIHWSSFIFQELAEKNEQKASVLLLDLLDEFLECKI
ncbi:hypothetical protein AAG747_21005 [Rapidithrix thailandica]|uniref:Uncharacterized protein n=1 Tax=Rapidithrix thailandica TaxID=413964 RepID=A0AAW9SBR3_9BACT